MKTLKSALRENCKECNSNGYFDSYKQNVYKNKMEQRFQEMFDAGDGNELHSKAEAVHSSSMLAYNFFHWIKDEDGKRFTWEGVTYSEVYFEVKMKAISKPANMDVLLVGEKNGKKHLLFIESKFLEYIDNNSFKLSDSYKKNNEIKWEDIINNVPLHKGYMYGIKQNITHLFGIHGLKNGGGFTGKMGESLNKLIGDINYNNMEFINLIFHPAKIYEDESKYNGYKNLFEKFEKYLTENKKELGLEVIPKWVSYSKLWKEMENQIPDEKLKRYLNDRYMQYACPNEQ